MERWLAGCFVVSGMIWLAIVPAAAAQNMNRDRSEYLAAAGLEDEAAALEEYLRTELVALGYENADNLGRFFSFVMAIHGLDRDRVARLEAGGIDVVRAMTSEARPFIEQGLFSDPSIVGEVIGVSDSGKPGDGYGATVTVRVLETLKGSVDADTVVLRQRGTFAEGLGPRGFVPEVGRRYLLLLSRPMYQFFVWRRATHESARAVPAPGHYAIYRSYLAEDGRVVMADGSSYRADDVFQELRWLDELVKEL